MPLGLPRPRLTPEVRRLMRIMLPGAFGSGVVQVNLLVSTAIASLLPDGSVSYLQYADRLNQLPLAVVGIAVGTAILPPLSRQVRTGDDAAAAATQNRGLELALLLTLPAAIALALAAHPLLAVLFQHGAFGAAQTAATAPALAAYAAGLPAFVLIKVLAPGFFARHDTTTPVKVALAAMVVNVSLTLLLGLALGLAHVGVALALTAAGWVNALLLMALLNRRGHFAFDARSRRSLPRILAAALAMGVLLLLLEGLLAPALGGSLALRVAALAVLVGGGLLGFALFALVFGAADWRELKRRLRRQAA
jgi:putative peptidoglycan lipid II flippase